MPIAGFGEDAVSVVSEETKPANWTSKVYNLTS
jgi:hypothetical protein